MNINDVYLNSINQWSKNKGIGTISFDQSLDLFEPTKLVLNKYFAHNPNRSVIIVVNNNDRINQWSSKLITGFNYPDKLGTMLNFVTADDIISKNRKDSVELLIIDQIDRFTKGERINIIKQKYIKFKYILGLTNVAYPDGYGNVTKDSNGFSNDFVIYDNCPIVNRITKVDIITHGIMDGVVEYNVPVMMCKSDKLKYDEINQYIKDTIELFNGDFDLAMKCYMGDSKLGISADHFRNELAMEKGWSSNMDVSSEYFAAIDRYYNPNSIYERAKTLMGIIKERQVLLSDNKAKINTILELISNNKDKKILIISKRSVFAKLVCDSINSEIENVTLKKDIIHGNLFKPATELRGTGYGVRSNAQCVEYHPDIESQPLIDPASGDYIRVKSGNNAGKVKMFGAASLCKIANQRYEEDFHNVVSSVSSIPKEANFEIDAIIFTSPECNTYNQLQYRVARLKFKENVKIVNIYLKDTKESDKLREKQTLTTSKIFEVKDTKDVIL